VRAGGTANGEIVPRAHPPGARDASLRVVRIALARGVPQARLSSAGEWALFAADGRTPLGMTQPGETWVLEPEGPRVKARRDDSRSVTLGDTPVIARPAADDGTITFNGRRWRGELRVSVSDGGALVVVNHVRMDDYLKGVVPLEIGTRAMADGAAVEAQAVAARSYAYMHLAGAARAYDMLATTADQVYGGVTAESLVGSQAVDNTAGLVLLFDGRVVNAPYHGNCGGFTAEPDDAWRTGGTAEPYLRRVSDQIPGTNHFYCESGPKFRWTRTFTGEELRQSIVRYLRTAPRVPETIASVRAVGVAEVTPAGRVATLTVDTDRGRRTLRGNEIRAALRTASGEMLYSTYFSADAVEDRGVVQSLALRGGGNGHGVGMCQSGAIGRARAGQDFRTILGTYYPGTTVGIID
jgi:stage II sporulation protein D